MGAVILGLASDEEHHHDWYEGGEERDHQEGERLKPGELLADWMVPEFHGNEGCGTERGTCGRHGGGCTDDSRGCGCRLFRAD